MNRRVLFLVLRYAGGAMGGTNQDEYLLGKKVDKTVGVDGTDDIAAGAAAVGVSEREHLLLLRAMRDVQCW